MILQDYNQPTVNYPFAMVYDEVWVCQTFTTTSSYDLYSAVIKAALVKYFGHKGTVHCRLYAVDGNHKPTGAVLATASKPVHSSCGCCCGC